ncbi:MAG: YlxR family protein [Erysipelotrichaceae bacterium]|nr:YlxR family protein [Erysipelotrichaceae bacterium]MBR3693419.1 YlxR family protein [Erysipelotrichales bacterium]
MKKIPLRKCIATNEQLPKKELVRVVKSKEGVVSIDTTGRSNGRGAYLKPSLEAIEIAQKQHLLDRALETKVPTEIYDQLKEMVSNA